MPDWLIAVLMLLTLATGILGGFPLGWVMGGIGLAFGLPLVGWPVITLFLERWFNLITNLGILALPFFIFMGVVLRYSGTAENLFNSLQDWLGGMRGGLAIATCFLGIIMGAATGIIGASVVAMGLLALPAMQKRGYSNELSTGVVSAAGSLGIIIPPSVMIVLYGALAEVSIGRLFFAAAGPGLLLGVLYILYILVYTRFRPNVAPAMTREEMAGVTWGRRLKGVGNILPPVFLIIAVLGTIFFGIATPTEAAVLGALASLILAAAMRRLNLGVMRTALYETASLSGMVFTISVGAIMFIGVFNRLGGSNVVKEALITLGGGGAGSILLILAFIFLMGFLIDWLGILFMVGPILSSLVPELGVNGVWLGAVVMTVLQTSFLTPPFAFAIFYLRGLNLPGVTLAQMYRGIVPFVILQLIGVALVYQFPAIALWLPDLMIRG